MSDDIEKMVKKMVASAQQSDRELPITPALAGMFGKLEKLSWLDGEDVLLGTVAIFGVNHFVTCVRVQRDELGIAEPTRDPHDRLEDILAGSFDGAPETVTIPGFEGEWVIGVDPYRD